MARIFLTGVAGFIGFHLASKLLNQGEQVIGFDNLNDYYDVNLKKQRLSILKENKNFVFYQNNLENLNILNEIFKNKDIDYVVNLAAQAGVRYSLENPAAFVQSNLVGFANILEVCRHHAVKHLVYASTSSVYGLNQGVPFSEKTPVNHPMTLYSATKKSNEMMAHAYSHLFRLPTTGLRFFTVYGPWGRPDMALFIFTDAIVKGLPINVFNHGNMIRDFTYVDDIAEGIKLTLFKPAEPSLEFSPLYPRPDISSAPYRIFNIGNQKPVQLMDYIRAIEKNLKLTAKIKYMPMQDGDVPITQSDTSALKDWVGYIPQTTIEEGVKNFVEWYQKR